ncbi:MAG TPA: hypothetical protein VGR48_20310 [Terriglobales bacterium]|nr:hypothetical protein [Terriglobales bacterium]
MRLYRWYLCITIVLCSLTTVMAQVGQSGSRPQRRKGKSVVRPLKNARALLPAIQTQSASSATIPLWKYSLVSPQDGVSYSGSMVGRSPFAHGFRSTSVPAYLIPVIMTFSDGTVLDPTAPNSCLNNLAVAGVTANSPIFQNAAFNLNGVSVGNTQYIDAFQRANFWTNVSPTGNRYHTLLNLTTLPAVNVTVPAADGGATNLGIFFCTWGDIDINWFDSLVENTLLPNLAAQGVAPNTIPIFLFDSVNMCDPYDPSTVPCGILGYHSAYMPSGVLQTYIVSDFDNSGLYMGDVSVLSHEVGEWMDDPVGTNPTPAWGNTGQVVGCQNNLEDGDPLTGTDLPQVTMNNFNYTLQELVFFSWFFRQSPSLGTGGKYSDNGTFTSGAGPVC